MGWKVGSAVSQIPYSMVTYKSSSSGFTVLFWFPWALHVPDALGRQVEMITGEQGKDDGGFE